MNIVLIGFRCSGKSSVGRELASRLGREFIDCDDYIEERTGLSIREIFDLSGESHFRTLESQAINDLAKLDGMVLATGGGAPLKRGNMQELKRHGSKVFYLEVGPETAFRRMGEDPATRARRPALTDEDPFTEIKQQIEYRRPMYRDGADFTVRTDGKTVDDIVAEMVERLKAFGVDERPDADAAAV